MIIKHRYQKIKRKMALKERRKVINFNGSKLVSLVLVLGGNLKGIGAEKE